MLAWVLIGALGAAPAVRLGVLPFGNQSGEPRYDVLQRGLGDMVATDLAGLEGVVVVERARLDAVLGELALQRGRAFDPATAAKAGALAGATHLLLGTVHAVAPRVRLDVRVVEVRRATVLASASVSGAPEDLFELERDLVAALARALQARRQGPPPEAHASLGGLLAYSQGAVLADRGDLDGARVKLAEAVREAPGFQPAKDRYAEVLKGLKAAQRRRGSAQEEAAAQLEARLEALAAPVKGPAGEALDLALGVRLARSNLALLRLSALVEARRDGARWVPPSRRAQAEALEAAWLENGARLFEELRALRGVRVEPRLPEAEAALARAAFGVDLADWSWVSPTTVALELGAFLASGWTPHASDVPQFAVRPSPAQRSPGALARALAWFDAAEAELPLDAGPDVRPRLAGRLANERAEAMVLQARREEAAAHWQRFLDAYPTAEDFGAYSAKLEALMGLSDEAEAAQAQLARCDGAFLERALAHANRAWRAGGRAGLVGLARAMLACGRREPRYLEAAFSATGAEAQRAADCPAWLELRALAAGAGRTLEPGPQPCLEP